MSETQTAPVARIVANDPRADSGQREIAVTADSIAIDRCVAGVRMRLSLPTRSFRGVALALQQGARGLFYRVALVHADPDLDVALAEADNERDAARDWLAWAQFFRLPRLTRGVRGGDAVVESRFGAIKAGAVQPRRRGWPLKARRSAISARRKAGMKGRVLRVHRDEREIVCYE
jgi:hypothetical protein